jgi:hypothetical protein
MQILDNSTTRRNNFRPLIPVHSTSIYSGLRALPGQPPISPTAIVQRQGRSPQWTAPSRLMRVVRTSSSYHRPLTRWSRCSSTRRSRCQLDLEEDWICQDSGLRPLGAHDGARDLAPPPREQVQHRPARAGHQHLWPSKGEPPRWTSGIGASRLSSRHTWWSHHPTRSIEDRRLHFRSYI